MDTGLPAQLVAVSVNIETLIESVYLMLKATSRKRKAPPSRMVSEVTMLAARHCPLASLKSAGDDEDLLRTVREHWEHVVYARYAFKKTRRFSNDSKRRSASQTVRLIVIVVSSLIAKKKLDIEALHHECGWE
jgi:hypothetical protein